MSCIDIHVTLTNDPMAVKISGPGKHHCKVLCNSRFEAMIMQKVIDALALVTPIKTNDDLDAVIDRAGVFAAEATRDMQHAGDNQ